MCLYATSQPLDGPVLYWLPFYGLTAERQDLHPYNHKRCDTYPRLLYHAHQLFAHGRRMGV